MSQLSQWLNPRSSAAKMAVALHRRLGFRSTRRTTPSAPWVALLPVSVIHDLKLWQVVTYCCIFQRSRPASSSAR